MADIDGDSVSIDNARYRSRAIITGIAGLIYFDPADFIA